MLAFTKQSAKQNESKTKCKQTTNQISLALFFYAILRQQYRGIQKWILNKIKTVIIFYTTYFLHYIVKQGNVCQWHDQTKMKTKITQLENKIDNDDLAEKT